MSSSRHQLLMRHRPSQSRAQETFELILATTALLLEEVGFDQLTTNLVCQRAGVTPPAIYRYFPNKYAILKELGERLMNAQNEVSVRWMACHTERKAGNAELTALLMEQFEVTRAFVGAKWVMRSLRSVPMLAQVRLDSHEKMNALFTDWYQRRLPKLSAQVLARRVRITNEAGYAVFEMLLDGDFSDVEQTLSDTARMFGAFDAQRLK